MRGQQFNEEAVTYYWRTYYEWRIAYGSQDACMDELIAAVHVAMEHESLNDEQLARLQHLIDAIEAERRLSWACVA